MKSLFKAMMVMILLFITVSANADNMITYDAVNKTVSAQIPDGVTMAQVLKEFGQKTGVKVSVEKHLVDSNIKARSLSFGDLSVPEAVAVLTSPYYFKIFVMVSNLANMDSDKTFNSLVVYRKWKNNEPSVVLYAGLIRKISMKANARIIGSNGKITGTKAGVKDWDPGEETGDFWYLSSNTKDDWIDSSKNPDISSTANGAVMFAYILGKENHTSALVKAVANTSGGLKFTLYVIKGQIDDDGESKIDYFTKLSNPVEYGNTIALKTNYETLPSWEEVEGSNDNMPLEDYYIKTYDNEEGWTFEFEVANPIVDASDPGFLGGGTDEHIFGDTTLGDGYHLVYIEGGNDVNETDYSAYCLVHIYSSNTKARLLILDGGIIEDDPYGFDNDVFINSVTKIKTLTVENENFDNVVYKNYQDMFLLNPIDKTSANSPIIAEYLPSHLLYSIEDYLWDPVRFKVVANGSEVADPYIDAGKNSEGTVGEMFRYFKTHTSSIPADNLRTPIIFIHGWQGDRSTGYDILKGYGFGTFGSISDAPCSGEAYWRNLLTYMYKYYPNIFKEYKPYVYHYPSYKHVTFNARMLESLINDIRNNTAGSSLEYGYDNNKIILIGHSMGTIVSRSVMEQHNLFSHVQKFISLAGVHHGSPGAMASLIDTAVVAGKDLYSPGACDLISDNYDGLIGTDIKADIQSNNLATWELLGQRAQAGCVYEDGNFYSDKASFDLHHIGQLTNGPTGSPDDNSNWYVKDQEVPVYSNPWLLNMNQKFIATYQNSAKNKYIFFAGYLVSDVIGFDPVPKDPLWTDTLAGSFAMNGAGCAVSGASGYEFTDAVVPLSYGILDFSRGKLLNATGVLDANYDKGGKDGVPVLDNGSSGATENKLQATYFYKIDNNWGAPARIVYDHDHDQILNGGYGDVMEYRKNGVNQGDTYKSDAYFQEYYAYVAPNAATPSVQFQNDPVFTQIRFDIVGCSADSLDLCNVKNDCETATGIWCGGECKDLSTLNQCPEADCSDAGGIWCNGECRDTAFLTQCDDETNCTDANGKWCGGVCYEVGEVDLDNCTTQTNCEAAPGKWCNGNSCILSTDNCTDVCDATHRYLCNSGNCGTDGSGTWCNATNECLVDSNACPTCDGTHLDLCLAKNDCEAATGKWCGGVCYKSDAIELSNCNDETDCQDVGGVWCNSECKDSAELVISDCSPKAECETAGGIWCNTCKESYKLNECPQADCVDAGGAWCDSTQSCLEVGVTCNVCDGTHLGLCASSATCIAQGGKWCNNLCFKPDDLVLEDCKKEGDCTTAGAYWCNDACQGTVCLICDSDNQDLCITEESCETTGNGIWCNGQCWSDLTLCNDSEDCTKNGGIWCGGECKISNATNMLTCSQENCSETDTGRWCPGNGGNGECIPNATDCDPVCDVNNQGLCDATNCETEGGGVWCNGTCNVDVTSCPQGECNGGDNGYWYDGACHINAQNAVCDANNQNLCTTQESCGTNSGYWIDNKCYAALECKVATIDQDLKVHIPYLQWIEADNKEVWSADLIYEPQDGRILFRVDLASRTVIYKEDGNGNVVEGSLANITGKNGELCETATILSSNYSVQIPNLYSIESSIKNNSQIFASQTKTSKRNANDNDPYPVNATQVFIGQNMYYEIDNENAQETIKAQCSSANYDACITEDLCQTNGGTWADGACSASVAPPTPPSPSPTPVCNSYYLHLCNESKCESYEGFWYDDSCHAQPYTPECGSEHFNLCTSQTICEVFGGNWCNDKCQDSECDTICDFGALNLCDTKETCETALGTWCNDACQTIPCEDGCSLENLDSCTEKTACEEIGANWCNNKCQITPCEEDICSLKNLELCTAKAECNDILGLWCNNQCMEPTPQNFKKCSRTDCFGTSTGQWCGGDNGECLSISLICPATCSFKNLNKCTDIGDCVNVGGIWCGDSCKTPSRLSECNLSSDCTNANGIWCNERGCLPDGLNGCNADCTTNPSLCADGVNCKNNGGYWYGSNCYTKPECKVATLNKDLSVHVPYLNWVNEGVKEVWAVDLKYAPRDGRMLFKVITSIEDSIIYKGGDNPVGSFSNITGKDGELCESASILSSNLAVHIPSLYAKIPDPLRKDDNFILPDSDMMPKDREYIYPINGVFVMIDDERYYEILGEKTKEIVEEQCSRSQPEACLSEDACQGNGIWSNNECLPFCTSSTLELCEFEDVCNQASGFWYNNICNALPNCEVPIMFKDFNIHIPLLTIPDEKTATLWAELLFSPQNGHLLFEVTEVHELIIGVNNELCQSATLSDLSTKHRLSIPNLHFQTTQGEQIISMDLMFFPTDDDRLFYELVSDDLVELILQTFNEQQCNETKFFWYNDRCNATPECGLPIIYENFDLFLPLVTLPSEDMATLWATLSFAPEKGRILYQITKVYDLIYGVSNYICESTKLLLDFQLFIPNLYYKSTKSEKVIVPGDLIYSPTDANSLLYEVEGGELKKFIMETLDETKCGEGNFLWRNNRCIFEYGCEASTLAEELNFDVPIIQYNSSDGVIDYLNAKFEYFSFIDNELIFKLSNYSFVGNQNDTSVCVPATLLTDLKLHIPKMNFVNEFDLDSTWAWLDLQGYITGNNVLFKLVDYELIDDNSITKYTEAEHNKTIKLKVGTSINVSLKSDIMNEKRWKIKKLDQAIIKNTNNTFFSECTICEGNEIWSFKTLSPGITSLEMAYYATSDETTSLKTFILTIQVE